MTSLRNLAGISPGLVRAGRAAAPPEASLYETPSLFD